MPLNIGDHAPDFSLSTDSNSPLSLKSLKGKKVVLYFYPKDNTPGCTQESCDFRDHHSRLQRAGAEVIGISKDSVASHEKFKIKYQLPFPLLSDPDGKVSDAFEVLKKKSLFGKSFNGIERSTFLIDEKGLIQAIWRKVSVKGHVEEVLHAIHS